MEKLDISYEAYEKNCKENNIEIGNPMNMIAFMKSRLDKQKEEEMKKVSVYDVLTIEKMTKKHDNIIIMKTDFNEDDKTASTEYYCTGKTNDTQIVENCVDLIMAFVLEERDNEAKKTYLRKRLQAMIEVIR